MKLAGFLTIVLLFGCSKIPPPRPTPPTAAKTTELDTLLSDPARATAMAEAQQDLPQDVWEEQPWRRNVSRQRRESDLAIEMLAEIKPRLKAMTVTELINSLKVSPHDTPPDCTGVAYVVYKEGNARIIRELKACPHGELRVLTNFADPKLEVFGGDQGPGDTLAGIINFDILKKDPNLQK